MFIRWICYSLAIIFTGWLIPDFEVDNFLVAMLAAVIIALINTFIKPILQIITLPINILTIGLFSLVLNALLLMLASIITPGFEIENFLSAVLASIVLSLIGIGINKI